LFPQHLDADLADKFFDVDYALPENLTHGKQRVRVRFVAPKGNTAGPVFGVRILMDTGEQPPGGR
jgi:hypothetical protein